MRALCMATLTALLTLPAATARADGLLYQLPEDGAWVRFDMEVARERGGEQMTIKGSMAMSSVGQTTIEGEKCRWIEVEMRMKRGEDERTFITKLLIPEKHLKKGEKPLDHVVKAWQKQGAGEARELKDPYSSNAGPLPAFLSGPLKDPKELDKELVESKLGKLQCAGLTGRAEFKQGQTDAKVTFHTRLHEKAPFGVVTCRMVYTGEREGQPPRSVTVTLKLTEVGDKATSKLPDRQ